jgi:hypothetical protein
MEKVLSLLEGAGVTAGSQCPCLAEGAGGSGTAILGTTSGTESFISFPFLRIIPAYPIGVEQPLLRVTQDLGFISFVQRSKET